MKKFFATILVLLLIILAIPVTFASSVLETIFNPEFLIKDAVIETIHGTVISQIEAKIDKSDIILPSGITKKEVVEIGNKILTKELIKEILIIIKKYLEDQKPFQKKLESMQLDLKSIKEQILQNVPNDIPIAIIQKGLKEIPDNTVIEIPLTGLPAQIISTILAYRIFIQILLWVLILIPVMLITLLLRKTPFSLCLFLGIPNIIIALIWAGITKAAAQIIKQSSGLEMDILSPLIDIFVKHFYLKAAIFGIIGIILIILAILIYNRNQKNNPIEHKPKKILEGILKKGSEIKNKKHDS